MVPRALPEAPEKAEKGFPEHLEKAVDYRKQGGGKILPRLATQQM